MSCMGMAPQQHLVAQHRAPVSIGQDDFALFQFPQLQLDGNVLRDAEVLGPGVGGVGELGGAVNQAHVVSEKGFGCREARHGCLITPVAATREISPCPSARSELRARFLPIDAVLFGQQGEVGVQSCSVELVGGVELHSGAE